ncbi:hypothetical protein ACLMJK_008810 [Lecanora helva]
MEDTGKGKNGQNPKILSRIPERKSSRQLSSGASVLSRTSHGALQPLLTGSNVAPKGTSTSPIRRPDTLRKAPSRTFVPALWPTDLLDTHNITHSRIDLGLRLSSPVFMGGATVEGSVCMRIDGGSLEKRRRTKEVLSIQNLSVTLVGIERCKGRQEIFRVLRSDLIDEGHPPPSSMALNTGFDGSWDVGPSDAQLPFCVDLPVSVGPPPYKSKRYGITYWLTALVEFTVAGKKHYVRQSREIVVLTVHDPEKALVNLKYPLSVSDELILSKRSNLQVVKLTAGLHRQTWISGYPVFIDIHIENRSDKDIKRLELQLEKTTLFHSYSAPSTATKVTDTLRVPDILQRDIIASTQVTDGWTSVRPMSQDFRTCQMDLPSGLVSIETGRFFGIRFFLNVQVTCSFSKHLKVQLPISIVHPNSIDIPPNALAQVAASIERKHRNITSGDGTGSPYRYAAGQAFKAARRRSYLELRKDTIGSAEMQEVTRMLEGSPRKMASRLHTRPPTLNRPDLSSPQTANRSVTRRQTSAVLKNQGQRHHQKRVKSYQALVERPSTSMGNTSSSNPRSPRSRSSYDTVRALDQPRFPDHRRPSLAQRPSLEVKARYAQRGNLDRGPRLQRSTSGLGFDDSSPEAYPSIS